jgi:diguanylate cyclase (GGDEF)-like protein/PAS domain S-box-containing protein
VGDYYSRQWKIFSGVELSGPGSTARIDLVHPEDRADALAKWRRCVRSGRDYEAEYRLRNAAGEYRWVLGRGRADVDSSGRPVRWFGTCTDVHEQVMTREALKNSEARTRGILEASADCVSFLDLEGNVISVNQATLGAYGLDGDAPLLNRQWGDLLPEEFHQSRDRALAAAKRGDIGRLSVKLPSPGGGVRWLESLIAPVRGPEGKTISFVVSSRDITHQKSIEEQVRWSAAHDGLTNLPNRALFQQRLEETAASACAGGPLFALLLLDIDHFKQVNDTLGHDAGDSLLVTAAARLRDALRGEDFVARLGGDEFAIIIGNVQHSAEVAAVADKIFASLRRPWHHAGRLGDCRVSIGANIFSPGDRALGDIGELTSRLLKDADIALYNAKANGRGQLAVFSAGMRDEIEKRSSMIALAKTAIDGDLIVPHYQPKVHLKTRKVIGFEALLRWNHPTRGAQLPATISAAFEDLELAAQISERIISRAIEDMRVWLSEGVDFGHVALNVAAADFRSWGFADRLLEQLEANSIPHRCVQVEVTETVFLGRGAEYVECAENAQRQRRSDRAG